MVCSEDFRSLITNMFLPKSIGVIREQGKIGNPFLVGQSTTDKWRKKYRDECKNPLVLSKRPIAYLDGVLLFNPDFEVRYHFPGEEVEEVFLFIDWVEISEKIGEILLDSGFTEYKLGAFYKKYEISPRDIIVGILHRNHMRFIGKDVPPLSFPQIEKASRLYYIKEDKKNQKYKACSKAFDSEEFVKKVEKVLEEKGMILIEEDEVFFTQMILACIFSHNSYVRSRDGRPTYWMP